MRTRQEYHVAAMLLGMDYDKHDHTFNEVRVDGYTDLYDPDTMKYICSTGWADFDDIWTKRKIDVQCGKLPPKVRS